MELNHLIYMLRKKLILIVIIPILASFLTAMVSSFYLTPVYQASSTLYIVNQDLEADLLSYDKILANEHLVKDYSELMKSKLITKIVIEELGIKDITPAKLSNSITVTSKNDSKVLLITVKDISPVRAKDLTNKICEVFINKSQQLMKVNNINIVDEAEVENKPIYPKPLFYTTLAFILSISATIGFIYILEMINETIKSTEDIEAYLGLNVLGTIPSFKIK